MFTRHKQEDERTAKRRTIQQNENSLKAIYGTLLKSPAKSSGINEPVQASHIKGSSASTTGATLRAYRPPVTEAGHNHQMDNAIDRHDTLQLKWDVFAGVSP